MTDKPGKPKTYYMHTIDGIPAAYWAAQKQICYMMFYGKASPLAATLKQIRQEQDASIQHRIECGFDVGEPSKYGYRRVSIMEQPK